MSRCFSGHKTEHETPVGTEVLRPTNSTSASDFPWQYVPQTSPVPFGETQLCLIEGDYTAEHRNTTELPLDYRYHQKILPEPKLYSSHALRRQSLVKSPRDTSQKSSPSLPYFSNSQCRPGGAQRFQKGTIDAEQSGYFVSGNRSLDHVKTKSHDQINEFGERRYITMKSLEVTSE
ncbi:hypothetical protein KGM_212491 [Danaus plexippus plexippus]|uniref:Uncharacterized protein n=1 Tax=Danaus plexippus plexippus TaxID=278856 RepID=A0A212F6T4_DANPL|nr:hypothetical protein KGM_212491 [Danaus plexippus plexippus]